MKKRNIQIGCCLWVLTMNLAFLSCNNSTNKTTVSKEIAGKYVNNTFLEKMPNTFPDSIPFYSTEMNFYSKDSVYIANGFEGSNYAYKKEGDHYIIIGASWKGDMPFIFNQDGSISLIDSAWTAIASNSTFIQVPQNANKSFDTYLNEQMIAGTYFVYNENKPTTQKVIFTAAGQVSGLEDYTTYNICYSGDCVGTTTPSCHTICLHNLNDHTFALKIDKQNKTVRMFNIAEGKEDIKGEMAIKELKYDLRQ